MSDFRSLGLGPPAPPAADGPREQLVVIDRPLQQVLAFTQHSIDDVVNSPIAKARVLGFYKLHKSVHRRMEIVDLEKQWNEF